MAGNFNNWIPNDPRYKLTKIAEDKYKIITNLDIGYYQYKFTRGSWTTVETTINGLNLPDRTIIVNQISNQLSKNSIMNWEDTKGRHTASGNVLILDNHFPYPQFSRTKRIWVYLPADYYTSTKNYGVSLCILFSKMFNRLKRPVYDYFTKKYPNPITQSRYYS